MAVKLVFLTVALVAASALAAPSRPKGSKSVQEVNFGVPAPGISSYKTTITNAQQAQLEDRRKSWPHKREASRPKPQPKPKSSKSVQSVDFGVPAPGISSYKTTIINEQQAQLEDRRKSWPHKREASKPKTKGSLSVQEVNFGVPAPGISSYKTTITNAQTAELEDRRKSWPHKREASKPKAKGSMSVQEVNFGVPAPGISSYKTTITNAQQAQLEDRRKSWPHKREASRPKPQPKPKSSKSVQEVNFGVPAPGISSYKTTIINEQQAQLEDRRKSWPHKREASRPKPKPKSMSVQAVDFGVPAPGISSYKTTITNAQTAQLEDRRKSWPHKREASKPKAKGSLSVQEVNFGVPAPGISSYKTTITNAQTAQLEDRRKSWPHKREASKPKAKGSLSVQEVNFGVPAPGISSYKTTITNAQTAQLEDRRKSWPH